MSILAKCSNCKRLGGYAENDNDKICARCKNGKVAKEPAESNPKKIDYTKPN